MVHFMCQVGSNCHRIQIFGQTSVWMLLWSFFFFFFYMRLTLKSVDSAWSKLPSMIEVGLVQSVEGFKRKKREFCFIPPFDLSSSIKKDLPRVFHLPACPEEFGLACLYNHVSQFFKITLTLGYMYILLVLVLWRTLTHSLNWRISCSSLYSLFLLTPEITSSQIWNPPTFHSYTQEIFWAWICPHLLPSN